MKDSIFNASPMIDLHTHVARHSDRKDIVEIVSSPTPIREHVYTLERHPWHITDVLSQDDQEAVKILLGDPYCLALGEIGLDKLKGVSLEIQQAILRSILTVAAHEQKPVILHCVKAYDEIIQFKKEFSSIPNWVIHGFNKNRELAKQLLDHGFYLSINVQKNQNAVELLHAIPSDRLFLETDNSSFFIEDNYLRAAEIVDVELEELKISIAKNAMHFFRHE